MAIALAALAPLGIGSGPVQAGQASDDGPLATSPLFQKDNALGNIVVLYSDTNGPTSESAMLQTSFDYVPPDDTGLNAGLLTQEIKLLEQRPDIMTGFFGDGEIDVAVADLDGDGFDEFAAAWFRQNFDLRILIPQDLSRQGTTDPFTGLPTLDWTSAATLDLVGAGFPAAARTDRLRMTRGNFDADPEPELAVGYWVASGVQVVVIDTAGTLVPQVVADTVSTAPVEAIFDLVAGDFDGDGIDEIAVVGADRGTFQLSLEAEVYALTGGTLATVASTTLVAPGLGSANALYYLVAAAADVNSDPGEALVLAYKVGVDSPDPLAAEHRLTTLRVDVDTERISTQAAPILVQAGGVRLPPIGLAAADLDGDGRAEMVTSTTNELRVYRSPSLATLALATSEPLTVDANAQLMHRVLLISDLDPEPGVAFSPPEIVFATHFAIGICCDTLALLQVFGATATPGGPIDLTLVLESSDDRVGAGNAPNVIAIGAGLLNGPDVRLGPPRRFSRTSISTPMVMLSAPPLHFDVLGGQIFDVADCFPTIVFCGQRGNVFATSYEKKTVTNTNVTAEFHSDWSLSMGISGEVSGLGQKLEGSFKGTFGEGFSKVSSESRTETLAVVQNAIADDWIYAVTLTQDVWEYPVFVGDQTVPTGYVAVVRPAFEDPSGIQISWFNSKSWLAQSFQPAHEVGNILSYRDIAAPDEANAFAQEIRWSTGDLRTNSATGSGSWSLGSAEVTAVTTTNSMQMKLEAAIASDAGFEFDIAGFGVGTAKIRQELSGNYQENTLSTLELRFEQTVGINYDFGALDPGVGQTNYGVIPYAYWTRSGALVLDFAVRPELAQIGFPPTFWQEHYDTGPDPTFILPWRLDPEKGFNLGGNPVEVQAKREQTRDIRIEPPDPVPGETVIVSARVQNYSLQTSPGVELFFYLGDPDRGGTRIFPDAPGPILTGIINPRESAVVSFPWTLPPDIAIQSSRVYAVLDPNNEIPNEVHEGNNKAWNALAIPVPEPSAALLSGVALAVLALLRRSHSPTR